jgi:hypothetical protein
MLAGPTLGIESALLKELMRFLIGVGFPTMDRFSRSLSKKSLKFLG